MATSTRRKTKKRKPPQALDGARVVWVGDPGGAEVVAALVRGAEKGGFDVRRDRARAT